VSEGGFEPEAFDHLAGLEEGSFWFRARNELILWALDRYAGGARSMLEIGAGTGFVLTAIHTAYPEMRLVGTELFEEGLKHARRRLPDVELHQIDARELPYQAEFDVVGAFDVLEHIDDDRRVLREVYRALRVGGTALITVPQHPWMWSAADDYAHHVRRYRRRELRDKLAEAGLVVRRLTSFVSVLLPAMALSRLLQRGHSRPYDPVAEHEQAARLRAPLEAVLRAERALIAAGVSLPAGGSLLAVAQRTSSAARSAPR
jgi:SAM-dependent methyltransferase